MSCGHHHDIDCAQILALVTGYLDDELDTGACADIRQHLEECGPCLRELGIEQEVKALIARSCSCGPAPLELRAQVVARLRVVRAEGHLPG
ncbi:MAG: mycothiol system anti-sigma-R factor [Actinomycetota bacterium]|nr:MAG: mycothiol system anti-sigma-R factor [Actinomycetota bacterium]